MEYNLLRIHLYQNRHKDSNELIEEYFEKRGWNYDTKE